MNSDDDQFSVSSDSSKARSTKGSFRRRLKSIGSSADRSRHSIIDGTRTVGSRVKKALARRTSKEIAEIKEEAAAAAAAAKEEGAGACEIFDSIKFDFPASPPASFAGDAAAGESSDEAQSALPPPRFPPPPLPAHYFDDVFSDRSSASYSDSQYELLGRRSKATTSCSSEATPGEAGAAAGAVADNFDARSDTPSLDDGSAEADELRSGSDDLVDSFNRVFANFDMKPMNEHERRHFDSFFSSSETGSSGNSVELRSSAGQRGYENWAPAAEPPALRPRSPTPSVFVQFDPLYDTVCADEEPQQDERQSLSDIFGGADALAVAQLPESPQVEVRSVVDVKPAPSRGSGSIVSRISSRFRPKVPFLSAQSAPNSSCGPTLKVKGGAALGKPEPCLKQGGLLHNGYLFKSAAASDKAAFTRFWCRLAEGKLTYLVEKDAAAKETIQLDSILSIHLIKDNRMSPDGQELHCFELNVSTRAQKYLFATLCASERCVWMQKLFQNLTMNFPARLSADYTRAGWCFLKECINGKWSSCWLLLQKRTLIYTRDNELVEIDLRKARSVGMQETDDAVLSDRGSKQVIVLDKVSRCLHLIMGKENETLEWQRVLRAAAINNSMALEDQQLTKDDLPVIVDKCINFVYAHGSMSEGIYRRSGSNSNVTKLLSAFRQDSWSVQLSHQNYSEFEVANVLKRFFSNLPEPLFTLQLHKHFCNAPVINCSEEDKLSLYRSILEQLKPINYVTVRKLIGHLHSIQQQEEKNLMTVENLASIWAPTLMHSQTNESNQYLNQECKALADLISLFPKLFLIDRKELEREKKFREVLEKYHDSHMPVPPSFKPSGDLRVWIYLNSKESGDHVNITVDPNKTCEMVCQELAARMDCQPHLLCLHEVICNESLTRPLHYKEPVLDNVLRWSYWDEVDRKNNYLLLSTKNIIREILPLAKFPMTIYNELYFADRKTKSFKNHYFEFSGDTFCFYKDKKSSVKLREWNINNIIWYVGYESKRNPRYRWSITFIDKDEHPNRTKETPYFGYTLAGINKEDKLRWIAAFAVGQYPDVDLLMPVSLLRYFRQFIKKLKFNMKWMKLYGSRNVFLAMYQLYPNPKLFEIQKSSLLEEIRQRMKAKEEIFEHLI